MSPAEFRHSPNYVQSLERGLQVLRAFQRNQRSASVVQIAKSTGLARPVVQRMLLTLQYLGYVDTRGHEFFVTPRVLELGYSYLGSLDLSELAFHSMERLARQVRETCSIAVLDGSEIVYVLCVPVRRVISVALGVGARLPAFATSAGRVMLADLPSAELARCLGTLELHAFTPHTIHSIRTLTAELRRVHRQGYAFAVRELELRVCSAAVPILDGSGRAFAALNAVMPYKKGARKHLQDNVLPPLQSAKQAIEQAIQRAGWVPPTPLN